MHQLVGGVLVAFAVFGEERSEASGAMAVGIAVGENKR